MKYIFISFISASFLLACNNADTKATESRDDSVKRAEQVAAASDTANYTSVQWLDSTTQNIGKINEGQVAEVAWHFKNVGDKPLVVVTVIPGCGCTVAEKPEAPIAPGSEGVIKAKFDSKGQGEGVKEKTVNVQMNTKGSASHQLTFRGEVVKK